MSREGIPSAAQFKADTSPPKSSFPVKSLLIGRGSEMALIDSALAEWDAVHGGLAKDLKVSALRHISGACSTYLKNRIEKKTALSMRRKSEVRKLLDLSLAALKKIDTAEGAFAAKKSKATVHGKLDGKATSLSGGYAHERTSYLNTGKQYAAAASAIHDNIDNFSKSSFKTFAKAYDAELTQQTSNFGAAKAQKMLQVTYLTKSQRMAYLAIPNDGAFMRADGTALESTDVMRGRRMGDVWAMDRYGNMFVKDVTSSAGPGGYFNHSSFNAGNDVICAGVCVFNRGGVLVYIDNGSGHYKPDAEALRSALAFFAEEGVDLREMRVGLMNPATDTPVSYQALTVLKTPNIKPQVYPSDWLDAFDDALNLPHGPISA